MIKGLYIATSGMLVNSAEIDVRSNNIANVDTVGYRKENVNVRSFPEVLIERYNDKKEFPPFSKDREIIGSMVLSAVVNGTYLDKSDGPIHHTGNRFDLALQGKGFFVVQDSEGNEYYTRAGNFTLDQDGQLVTHQGYVVLGAGGPISVPSGAKFTVDNSGNVFIDGTQVDRLRIVDFKTPTYLKRVGDNLYKMTKDSGEPVDAEGYVVKQGYIEGSNVNIVYEMVNMIKAYRQFEAGQRVVLTNDETLREAISNIPRMG
ncbi:MAG: flagellar basal-body rod protein FlgF [Synergistetes bacterium]|nr:flagellar basal-body rod protein FlgF [Synergistota bacterium]